ncbi:MAG TPA: hypothetical protein VGS18_05425 [Thermoplasmata archaeon]|nr:hypothetical protein [Thermoplasmata archaeon]
MDSFIMLTALVRAVVSLRRRSAKTEGRIVGSLALVAILLLSGSGSSLGAVPRGAHLSVDASASPGPLQVTVTWNGADLRSAVSDASALAVDFSSTITLRYHWSTPSGGYNISTARLQMIYFGFPIANRDVVESNPRLATNGTFVMGWQPGALTYLLEGTYLLKASLLSAANATVWNENFFVHASAAYDIGAVIPILLLVIAAYELFALFTSGSRAAHRKAPRPPSRTPPAASNRPTGADGAGAEAPEDTSPEGESP